MKQFTNYIFILLLLFTITIVSNCGGGSSSGSSTDGLEPAPDFTPDDSDSLSSLVINTFLDNGTNITTNPEYIDFNDSNGDIAIDDELQEKFILSNDSGSTLTFKFQVYAISTGFSILDENKVNLGSWSEIEIADGDEETFYVQFNAWVFGTQTSYITITADTDGYIQFPLRAAVTGAADFRVIPSGYFCSDDDAPDVDYLDFYKVAHEQSYTHGIKLCNTGGEDIAVHSAEITNGDDSILSSAMDSNAFEDFIGTLSEEIEDSFSFGTTPTTTNSFSEPNLITYGGSISNPSASYDVSVSHSGEDVKDLKIEAGKLLHLDVTFSPDFDLEAGNGSLYNPLSVNSVLTFDTSLGTIQLPLVGATSGKEPFLKMSYRFSDEDAWREVDLNSENPAIFFDTVEIFRDWVSNNSKIATIKVENVGSGSNDLEFYGGTLNGYFEYYWDDDDEELSFPVTIPAGGEGIFKIRYLPSASVELDDDFEASWNFGHFYFDHTGGNGPNSKAMLVGEQDVGYAVELFLGGSQLEKEYDANQYKNLCVFKTDSSDPTSKTFKVKNNNKEDTLNVDWSVSYDPADLTIIGNDQDSFTVEPGSEVDFTIDFAATEDTAGNTVSGTLIVNTNYGDKETEFAALLTDLENRDFDVPFQATASETGSSVLCGGGVLGEEDTMEVTFIMDRVLLALAPSLTEVTRNLPAFKFHLPLELDLEKGTVRIRDGVPFIYDKEDPNFSPIKQIRSFVHQATNPKGCASLPDNPYRLEFQKGSWTGEGLDCADEGPGTITFNSPNSGESFTINSDTACLDVNGGEEYTDPTTGENWTVFYHDFIKFEDCNVQFYGKISTFAFKPDEEDIFDKFERIAENPNESESYYEQEYGAFQFESEIIFLDDFTCGSHEKTSGDIVTDPDELKEIYDCISTMDTSTRDNGYLSECAYFNFEIDEGVVPDDVDSANPDYESWEGFGIYEPHVDDDGNLHPTKYDITIFNGHMKAIVIGAGDRKNFFGHPGHLIFSHVFATLTTKRIADEGSDEDGTWQDRIAVNSRPHFDKNQIFLEDGEIFDIGDYFTEDGMSENFSNVIDDSTLEKGKNLGGFGKGNFRFIGETTDKIIPAGWPINYDENNLMVITALGAFTGKGNTAPSFVKADSTTGKGKSLYITFHGCLVAGDPEENQGCFDYQRDSTTMLNNENSLVIDQYSSLGTLPNGYVDAADCSNLDDPGFENFFDYEYMPCINFKIFGIDRDRLVNYYESNRFEYDDNSYYNSTNCGVGM